jgi:MFS family permease
VTSIALPSVAILTLKATVYQVGLLEALQFLAFPLLGMPAGVWVDRLPRRTVMIVADIGRAVALASILVAWELHALGLAQLYVVALIVGSLTVFFDVAYQAYLPSLIERSDLVDGNVKLEASRSAAQVAGNGLGGALVQAIGAPLAILVDSMSFVASVVSLGMVQRREQTSPTAKRQSFWVELREGASVVFGSPVLRNIAGCTATTNLGSGMVSAVFLIFAYRNLHLAPALVGVVLAFGNLGLFGALLSGRIANRFGLGRTLAVSVALTGISVLIAPLAALALPVVLLLASQLILSFSTPVYNVNQVSLRQAIVPLALQGRMNATMRTIVFGTLPIGSAVGGALGSAFGVIPTMIVAGLISLSAVLWIRLSDVFALTTVPPAI